jgi:hypothetical protein
MKATSTLHDLGQSFWLDNITRNLLTSGTLAGRLHRHIAHHFFHGGAVLGQEGGFCIDI